MRLPIAMQLRPQGYPGHSLRPLMGLISICPCTRYRCLGTRDRRCAVQSIRPASQETFVELCWLGPAREGRCAYRYCAPSGWLAIQVKLSHTWVVAQLLCHSHLLFRLLPYIAPPLWCVLWPLWRRSPSPVALPTTHVGGTPAGDSTSTAACTPRAPRWPGVLLHSAFS